jgi:hypothetical protein
MLDKKISDRIGQGRQGNSNCKGCLLDIHLKLGQGLSRVDLYFYYTWDLVRNPISLSELSWATTGELASVASK